MDAPLRLFVYGTLVSEQQLKALTGRSFPRRPATLHGFARIAPPDTYPYVVPSAGACVHGMVLDDVDAEALAALDAYEDEGRLYVRRAVEVTVNGESLTCQVYVGSAVAARGS